MSPWFWIDLLDNHGLKSDEKGKEEEEHGQERARVEHDGQAQGRIVDPEEQGADGDVARAGDREELGHPLQRAEGQRGAEADGDGFGGGGHRVRGA